MGFSGAFQMHSVPQASQFFAFFDRSAADLLGAFRAWYMAIRKCSCLQPQRVMTLSGTEPLSGPALLICTLGMSLISRISFSCPKASSATSLMEHAIPPLIVGQSVEITAVLVLLLLAVRNDSCA